MSLPDQRERSSPGMKGDPRQQPQEPFPAAGGDGCAQADQGEVVERPTSIHEAPAPEERATQLRNTAHQPRKDLDPHRSEQELGWAEARREVSDLDLWDEACRSADSTYPPGQVGVLPCHELAPWIEPQRFVEAAHLLEVAAPDEEVCRRIDAIVSCGRRELRGEEAGCP